MKETKVLFKGSYSCDGGSIKLFSNDFSVCFTNDYGDGEHPVTVVTGSRNSRGDFKGTVEALYDDTIGIASYDYGEDSIFDLPKGLYAVYADKGAITIEKWER